MTSPASRPYERRRHRFYRLLLIVTLFVMVCLALPGAWGRLTHVGYILLTLLLALELGQSDPGVRKPLRFPLNHFFRILGLVSVLSLVLWLFVPQRFGYTGVPLFILFSLFIGVSVSRLVHQLSLEQRVGSQVVTGALAGYLLLGLSGGLILTVLETITPGSFTLGHAHVIRDGSIQGLQEAAALSAQPVRVWEMNFMHINYFAFVSLTTVGYGDIVPLTPTAQMASIGLSIIGPLYIAVVMGLLISRLTSQRERTDRRPRSIVGRED